MKTAEEMLASRALMVTSERGSIRGKFRYYVVFGINKQPFDVGAFKKALAIDFLKQAVEVERTDIDDTHVLLTVLIAPLLAPMDYVSEVLGECRALSVPLYSGFLVSNRHRPSSREIAAYLRDFKPVPKTA